MPAWEDPDGPLLSDPNVSSDDLRRAAWYSFAGGAAGWGGFTVDYWSFGHGFNGTTTCYYRNLQTFIQDSGVQFWNMVPNQTLGADFRIAKSGCGYFYLGTIQVVNPQHAPLLRATRIGSTVVTSWPASTVGFVLQSENALSPVNWADVPNSVVVVGSEQTVTNTVSNTNKFFRLRSF